ncbi:hypothetical protein RF11_02346 [Thelohanellus kitauei]|uniref:Uncharacterized protein n=1 Tax=Thelohanellus kitauei TaxID=669202 RepID=A0A0C2J6D5_THEKT|nr:hypothetical protein RF11_02346 [Thelohanellus kitauei]
MIYKYYTLTDVEELSSTVRRPLCQHRCGFGSIASGLTFYVTGEITKSSWLVNFAFYQDKNGNFEYFNLGLRQTGFGFLIFKGRNWYIFKYQNLASVAAIDFSAFVASLQLRKKTILKIDFNS